MVLQESSASPSSEDDDATNNKASTVRPPKQPPPPMAPTTPTTPTTPTNIRNNNNSTRLRQKAWWQSSVVRRSSSAVDEAVDELTEKSQFLQHRRRSPALRSSSTTSSSSTTASATATASASSFNKHSKQRNCNHATCSKTQISPATTAGVVVRDGSAVTVSDNDDEEVDYDSQSQQDDRTNNTSNTIALFDRSEIQCGQLLGTGTFSCVYEVTGFTLQRLQKDQEKIDNHHMEQLRQGVAASVAAAQVEEGCDAAASAAASAASSTTSTTTNTTTYALKHLKSDLLTSTKDFEAAATDLVMEAKYLAALDHPGILKLRGLAFGGTDAFKTSGHHDGYFLLTDRLVETLAQRIERWKQKKKKKKMEQPAPAPVQNSDETTKNSIVCKTQYALQIADAVAYLHERRIIFRDLKPSNIGFDKSDRIQLFDFGLCRELPPECKARPYKYYPALMEETGEGEESEEYYASLLDESWNDCSNNYYNDHKEEQETTTTTIEEVYFMSGAGTQIYMAVEILINNRYNLKADVYSWSMVFWEMLTLQKPFPCYTMEEHRQYVCKEGDRPTLLGDDDDEELQDEEGVVVIPESLQELMEAAWVGNVSERLSMATVCQKLQEILPNLEKEIEEAKKEQEEQHIDDASLSRVFTYHLLETGSQVKQYLRAAIDWTLQSLISLFHKSKEGARGCSASSSLEGDSSSDSGNGAVSSSVVSTEETPSAAFSNPEMVQPAKETDQERDRATESDSASNAHAHAQPYAHASTSATTQSTTQEDTSKQPKHHNRHSMFKRKPSSASTTATTDDEYDEEDFISGYYNNNNSSSGLLLKSGGSMDVVVERRADSERSTV